MTDLTKLSNKDLINTLLDDSYLMHVLNSRKTAAMLLLRDTFKITPDQLKVIRVELFGWDS